MSIDPNVYPVCFSMCFGLSTGLLAYVWISHKEAYLRMIAHTCVCVSEIEEHLRASRKDN